MALPSNGCKIVHILGKADLCTTRCEESKGRWQCRDKQVVTKAYRYVVVHRTRAAGAARLTGMLTGTF